MTTRFALLAIFASVLAAPPVLASGSRFMADDPAWRTECGSCHTAYPPALMSAPAWRRIMGALDRHYGSDATMDAATVARVASFLEVNAGAPGRAASVSPAPDPRLPRVADGAWFAKEHREVSLAARTRPGIRGLGDCGACHAGADRGDFSERAVRVPQ